MSTVEHESKGRRASFLPAAWVAMPVVLTAYLVLRYAVGTATGVRCPLR